MNTINEFMNTIKISHNHNFHSVSVPENIPHRKCMEKFLGGHIFLVCSWIEALFSLTILTFEGLHEDI